MVLRYWKDRASMMAMFETIIKSIKTLKQKIDDWIDERDSEMEKWKEEDPEGYYEYIDMQYNKKY